MTCTQPGCGGTIQDGYCDTCGLAASGPAPSSAPSGPSAWSGSAPATSVRRQQLTVEVLRAALDWCTAGQPAGKGPILGCEPNARALRFGLERSYRALARLTPDEDRRKELVDMANAIRPRTLT
jgi:hypothetical protein